MPAVAIHKRYTMRYVIYLIPLLAFLAPSRLEPVSTPAEVLAALTRYPFSQAELDMVLNNDGTAWLKSG
jgi:hypothetical protein